MRHDGGNTLKYQDHRERLRMLPLNPMECGMCDPTGELGARLFLGAVQICPIMLESTHCIKIIMDFDIYHFFCCESTLAA